MGNTCNCGEVQQEDEWKLDDGKKHGPLTFVNKTYSNGARYAGQFDAARGVRHGQGMFRDPSGNTYEGCWVNDQGNGQGVFKDKSSEYSGQWLAGVRHGHGTERWLEGVTVYIGQFEHGEKAGEGCYKWSDGSSYEGQFRNDDINGRGKHKDSEGEYRGQFLDSTMHGSGVYKANDGSVYDGQWRKGEKEGEGTLFWPDGRKYSGQWSSDRQHGKGEFYSRNGQKQDVFFFRGRKCDDKNDFERMLDMHGGVESHNNKTYNGSHNAIINRCHRSSNVQFTSGVHNAVPMTPSDVGLFSPTGELIHYGYDTPSFHTTPNRDLSKENSRKPDTRINYNNGTGFNNGYSANGYRQENYYRNNDNGGSSNNGGGEYYNKPNYYGNSNNGGGEYYKPNLQSIDSEESLEEDEDEDIHCDEIQSVDDSEGPNYRKDRRTTMDFVFKDVMANLAKIKRLGTAELGNFGDGHIPAHRAEEVLRNNKAARASMRTSTISMTDEGLVPTNKNLLKRGSLASTESNEERYRQGRELAAGGSFQMTIKKYDSFLDDHGGIVPRLPRRDSRKEEEAGVESFNVMAMRRLSTAYRGGSGVQNDLEEIQKMGLNLSVKSNYSYTDSDDDSDDDSDQDSDDTDNRDMIPNNTPTGDKKGGFTGFFDMVKRRPTAVLYNTTTARSNSRLNSGEFINNPPPRKSILQRFQNSRKSVFSQRGNNSTDNILENSPSAV